MKTNFPYTFYISDDGGKTLNDVSNSSSFSDIIKGVYYYTAKSCYIKTPHLKIPKRITKEDVNKLLEGCHKPWLTDEENFQTERKYKISLL